MSALLDSFASAFDALPNRDAAGLGDARRDALAAALRDGLPGTRSERWKYTPLRAFERRAFVPSASLPAVLDGALLAGIPAPRIVFVNGRFDPAHSDFTTLPTGVTLQPLSQALAEGHEREVNFLARRFERADEVFARLNAALADDGVILRAEEGAAATQPIHLVFVGAPAERDLASHSRHLVELRGDAELTLVEHHLASDANAHFVNSLVHVHLAARARLTHVRTQEEAATASLVTRTDAVLARSATYLRLDLELGGALTRHELNVALQGEGAQVIANGVLLADGKRHLDTRLGIDHAARDTRCELLWRGLGAGRAKAAFHGGITIREGADGSVAELSNKNLLLSAGAEIDTQPVLEIHADEVQAAHGAAVGQLDATSMFYLRSRGIPEQQARALLTAAFCRETLAVIEDAVLRESVAAKLDAALSRLESAA
ncbi:Fe-S cluster assembly protein SufD [Lysobacter solisilvae (ex Woo and Kim 2020)]|uniref:Fe-S cluster assembly protein SufD n=1 Tax=Agrilutibacter terrestris TaxID=2865112 RepID=A0A7H0FYM6_9GAMM|nr:Fe-S cluster assembly protein SufD [Lysobacter terrestris]QNP41142.1 Fe-S cluster assembly protein SufD [Lysobacter terrestris]